MRYLRLPYRVAIDAFYRFLADDGWAIASHIALSALMSLFPFLILVTALAGFFGSKELADEVAQHPAGEPGRRRSRPRSRTEIHNVLTTARGDVLTIGVVLAIYFASSGIESLRIGLNRAYGVVETRSWWLLRLESIGYVLVGAVGVAGAGVPGRAGAADLRDRGAVMRRCSSRCGSMFNFLRLAVASIVLIVALVIVHKWLPAGRRKLSRDHAGHPRDAGAVAGRGRTVRPTTCRASPTPTSRTTPAWRRR